jgi:AraC-like DNA-binding protein
MLTQDYLNLRLIRIKASEQWVREGEGVCFVFARAGAAQYQKGATKQPLSPGDVLAVNGDAAARICAGKGAEFAFWAFSLRLDHLFPLFAGTEISLLRTILDGFKGSKFYPSSSSLAGECHKLVAEIPPHFNLDHRGQLLRLATVILNEEFKTAHGQRVGFVRAEEHMVQVFEKLSAEEMLNLSVSELAGRFGCSRRHLNRLFHHYFGFSVAALRMEMRLMKAVSLLRDCDAKVINVAEQCGFNHLGLFNTCFRKRFGTSPGQWRKAACPKPETPAKQNGHGPDCPWRMKGLCPLPYNTALGVQPAVETTAAKARRGVARNGGPNAVRAEEPTEEDLEITLAGAQKAARSIAFQVRAQK